MTPEQFCYWLQGRAELDPNPPTPEQWQSIREHLALVFTKVTSPLDIRPNTLPTYKPATVNWPDKTEFPPGTIICQQLGD